MAIIYTRTLRKTRPAIYHVHKTSLWQFSLTVPYSLLCPLVQAIKHVMFMFCIPSRHPLLAIRHGFCPFLFKSILNLCEKSLQVDS